MQLFACDNCHAPVFFDNYKCTSCGYALAFLPDLQTMSALEPLPVKTPPDGAPAPAEGTAQPQRFKALAADGCTYRMCQNHVEHGACGWAVPDEDPEPLCRACRLNNVIPDLTKQEQKEAWLRL